MGKTYRLTPAMDRLRRGCGYEEVERALRGKSKIDMRGMRGCPDSMTDEEAIAESIEACEDDPDPLDDEWELDAYYDWIEYEDMTRRS